MLRANFMITYNPVLASLYGITFGSQRENYLFKRMGENDCTNFISECIWAGYGGIEGFDLSNPTDLATLRESIISEERRVGKEGLRLCSSRVSAYH